MEPSCAETCISRFNFNSCPEVCTGVCECPAGTIIDEDSNKCVPENECPESTLPTFAWYVYIHDTQGCAVPDSECGYIRQIMRVLVTTV